MIAVVIACPTSGGWGGNRIRFVTRRERGGGERENASTNGRARLGYDVKSKFGNRELWILTETNTAKRVSEPSVCV